MKTLDDEAHVAELFRLMRALPLEEMDEAARLLWSIRGLRFALFLWDLPRPDIVDYSALDILQAPRSNRVLLAQYAKGLEDAAMLPDDQREEAYLEVMASAPLALVRK